MFGLCFASAAVPDKLRFISADKICVQALVVNSMKTRRFPNSLIVNFLFRPRSVGSSGFYSLGRFYQCAKHKVALWWHKLVSNER